MKLLQALRREPLERPPIWLMRQAGRHLPEYRALRANHTFQEAVSSPEIAAEITMQPIRRYGMDGAVIFADIMTPLEAMGVPMTFDPGPKLTPMTVQEVVELPNLDTAKVDFVAETIMRVRDGVSEDVAVVGFAGAPITLLAYLLEGGGSKEFMGLRGAIKREPALTRQALSRIAEAMNAYLEMQVDAGANVVQLFDSWAGLLSVDDLETFAFPAARKALAEIAAPTIYFAPGAPHALERQLQVDATAYGLDWRLPIDIAWGRIGYDTPVQGNLDPSVLLSDTATVQSAVRDVLERADGRPGHLFNLGHGVDKNTPPEHVSALVSAVRGGAA